MKGVMHELVEDRSKVFICPDEVQKSASIIQHTNIIEELPNENQQLKRRLASAKKQPDQVQHWGTRNVQIIEKINIQDGLVVAKKQRKNTPETQKQIKALTEENLMLTNENMLLRTNNRRYREPRSLLTIS